MIPAFADEKADKTEFDNLYVKFNDLYANSEDLGPIIEVGEKLYKLAPKVYGKNHINTATVTYKMARLYDQKGGDKRNADEKRAFELYDEYFKTLEALNTPYDHDYLVRYFAFVKAEYNAYTYKSNKRYYKNLLKILEKVETADEEKANILASIAKLRYERRAYKEAKKLFNAAKGIYAITHDNDSPKVGEMLIWFPMTETRRNETKDAIKTFKEAINILDKSDNVNDVSMTLTAYKMLIQNYSKKGDAEKATPYVLAYSHKRPNNDKQMRDPI